MTLRETKIPGLVLIEPKIFSDERGFFFEYFKAPAFEAMGLPTQFLQDNISESATGVLRGLHFQIPPFAMGKLVSCIAGSFFDVAVDCRKNSPTYGKWDTFILKASEPRALWVPEGFAHGMQSLEDGTRIFYKCTSVYSKNHEVGIRYDDPELNIPWPVKNVRTSPKDLELPRFREFHKINPF